MKYSVTSFVRLITATARSCSARRVIAGSASILTFIMLLPMLVQPSPLHAQERADTGDVRFSLTALGSYQFGSDVDGGGDLSVARYNVNAEVVGRIDNNLRIGIGLTYEFDDYDFSGLTDFAVAQPWGDVHRFGISVPIFYSIDSNWRLFLSPSVQWSGESGAKWGDAVAYGAVFAVSHSFRPGLVLGLGAGVFSNIEKTTFFPYIAVNWQINEQLRLINPFRTSPAGPAGLELAYAFNRNWELGIGGAYRSYRFRLDEDGPLPNGIGESKTVPVYARLSYSLSRDFRIDLYGGATFSNKLRVDNEDGDEIYRTKYDVPPLVALSLTARF